MTTSETKSKLSPGQVWLALPEEAQLIYLEGLIQGLNQGFRHCAGEVAFSLATRMPGSMTPDTKLAVDSLIQQTRTWAKNGVSIFKFSRPLPDYAQDLSSFYRHYSKYQDLPPAYLMIYMDDQHGMGPEELYSLHEHSLHGFKR